MSDSHNLVKRCQIHFVFLALSLIFTADCTQIQNTSHSPSQGTIQYLAQFWFEIRGNKIG